MTVAELEFRLKKQKEQKEELIRQILNKKQQSLQLRRKAVENFNIEAAIKEEVTELQYLFSHSQQRTQHTTIKLKQDLQQNIQMGNAVKTKLETETQELQKLKQSVELLKGRDRLFVRNCNNRFLTEERRVNYDSVVQFEVFQAIDGEDTYFSPFYLDTDLNNHLVVCYRSSIMDFLESNLQSLFPINEKLKQIHISAICFDHSQELDLFNGQPVTSCERLTQIPLKTFNHLRDITNSLQLSECTQVALHFRIENINLVLLQLQNIQDFENLIQNQQSSAHISIFVRNFGFEFRYFIAKITQNLTKAEIEQLVAVMMGLKAGEAVVGLADLHA